MLRLFIVMVSILNNTSCIVRLSVLPSLSVYLKLSIDICLFCFITYTTCTIVLDKIVILLKNPCRPTPTLPLWCQQSYYGWIEGFLVLSSHLCFWISLVHCENHDGVIIVIVYVELKTYKQIFRSINVMIKDAMS